MGLDDIQKKLDKAAANSFKAGCGTIMVLALIGVVVVAVVLGIAILDSAL